MSHGLLAEFLEHLAVPRREVEPALVHRREHVEGELLSDGEVGAFLDRVHLLRLDGKLFVMDTTLPLGDKVVPMLLEACRQVPGTPAQVPRRVERGLWALTPHVYVVNGKPDLLANIGRAIAEGRRALAPSAIPSSLAADEAHPRNGSKATVHADC